MTAVEAAANSSAAPSAGPSADAAPDAVETPDRYDAVALSTWEPLSLRREAPGTDDDDDDDDPASGEMDPYGGGAIDPYA